MTFKEKEHVCKFCGIINYKDGFLVEQEDPETKQRYLICLDCIEIKKALEAEAESGDDV